jgi:tripartite-type tricarboxylate transporter receptor subunit TctC
MYRFAAAASSPRSSPAAVDFGYSPIATSLPNIKDGRLQAIAVSEPAARAALPDVPTTLRGRLREFRLCYQERLFPAARAPRPIVEAEPGEMKRAWQKSGAARAIYRLDVHAMLMTARRIRLADQKEIADNAVLAKAAGLQPKKTQKRTETDMTRRDSAAAVSTLGLADGGPADGAGQISVEAGEDRRAYAPGGGTDITARCFGDQLKNSLGQQFVVENKPGAFGILAIEEMARPSRTATR